MVALNPNKDFQDPADSRNQHFVTRMCKAKRVRRAVGALPKLQLLLTSWRINWKKVLMINIETNMWAHCEDIWLPMRVDWSNRSQWLELGSRFMSMKEQRVLLTVKPNKFMQIMDVQVQMEQKFIKQHREVTSNKVKKRELINTRTKRDMVIASI